MSRVHLSNEECHLLKERVRQIDGKARLFVFGSRADLEARGGDIDLLILSEVFGERDKRSLRRAFCDAFGEQKVDIIVDKPEPEDAFARRVLPGAIEL